MELSDELLVRWGMLMEEAEGVPLQKDEERMGELLGEFAARVNALADRKRRENSPRPF